MPLRLWTLDVAREQNFTTEHLDGWVRSTRASGYDGIGFYLEHRFAYPSTPWAHGVGSVTPEMIAWLEERHPTTHIIPFVNVLGHMEGFLYSERGKRFAEERFKGMSACPSNEEFRRFAERLVDDTIASFHSEIIHLGGDETSQLGSCPVCAGRDKSELYGEHVGALARRVLAAGRRPAIWADMLSEHPTAADHLSKETLLFVWEYFDDPSESAQKLTEAGFEVVLCPTLHTYNSAWLNLRQAEANVQRMIDAPNFCLTTWEYGMMGNANTLRPAIEAVGKGTADLLGAYDAQSELHGRWARLMGVDLAESGSTFKAGRIRSSLRSRLLLYSNPFLAAHMHGEVLAGSEGDLALNIVREAVLLAPDADYRAVAMMVEKAIEFVRQADEARQAYAQELPGIAVASLAPCRQIFDDLHRLAVANRLNAGGSQADEFRCTQAKEHIERVVRRIRDFGAGQLGYLPSWETIIDPRFTPHDQGNWWRINSWGEELAEFKQ